MASLASARVQRAFGDALSDTAPIWTLLGIYGLASFLVARWLGIASSLLAAVIFAATIMLGWHYAVDGLMGGALALTCWWAAGRVIAWRRGPVLAPELQPASP